MKKISLTAAFVCLCFMGRAQVFHRLYVPVTKDDTQLKNPWLGGLNGPQWSSVDLNNDGKLDLYAFDRNGDKHLTFLNMGGVGEVNYEFAPSYASYFPPCRFYTLLRDYNRDGVMDLFACSLDEKIAGLKVFTGRYQNNQLVFDRLAFPEYFIDVILSDVGSSEPWLPINATDYPAIDDIDGDGDLDILTFTVSGSNVNLYQNMALEEGYTDDTLIYKLVDDCWGRFDIPPFSNFMNLSDSINQCVFFKSPNDPEVEERDGLHGGAALCTFDEDNDGDKELLFGDLIYPTVIRGKNCGTPSNAWVCEQDTAYPIYNNSVDIFDFPATFILDLDNDGIKDLLASPNLSSGGADENVGWFYKNTQTNEFPVFDFKSEFFMVGDAIDHGTGANPSFVDYNADGLLDIVMGNETVYNIGLVKNARLFLYKNMGTPTEPAFELADSDWLNFSQIIDTPQPYGFAPAFGDIDGDGDSDLVVGIEDGRLFYAENIAGVGNPLAFGPIIPYWLGIDVGQYATPCIHDINKDGLGDLVVGERNGTVNYLPNIGTIGNPIFHPNIAEAPNNQSFGAINTQLPPETTGYSSPSVFDTPDGSMFLVTGSDWGYLEYYKINPDSINIVGAPFEIIDEQLGGLREGWITRPSFGDLNGDNFLDCVIGNFRGGLGLFSSPIAKDGTVPIASCNCPAFGVNIYPNPTNDLLFVNIASQNSGTGQYRVFNSVGQYLSAGTIQPGKDQIDVSNLSQGIYFLEVKTAEGKVTKRFVKQ